MGAPTASTVAAAGALLFVLAAVQMVRYRDDLKQAHTPYTAPPATLTALVAAAAAACAWAAAAAAGTLRAISPAANQNALDRAPLRPDFVAAGGRAAALPADVPVFFR